jgi:hypothetical protein
VMSMSRLVGAGAVALALVLSSSIPAFSQTPATPNAEDTAAIQALVASYARTLMACQAQEYANLFAPGTGSFASGFRGRMVGQERLAKLVESERHCTAPPPGGPTAAPRPGGADGPTAVLEVTPTGVRGVAALGGAGQYEDEYVKTPNGWRFQSRTVITPAEKAAGLDAADLLAIWRLAGADMIDFYSPDQNGVPRLRTSNVAVNIVNGEVTGRAFAKDGGYFDDVYEKVARGQWRIKSRIKVNTPPPPR